MSEYDSLEAVSDLIARLDAAEAERDRVIEALREARAYVAEFGHLGRSQALLGRIDAVLAGQEKQEG